MRAFACPRCRQLVFFENVECLRCRAGLGFDPDHRAMVLVADGSAGVGGVGVSPELRCANRIRADCNWLGAGPEGGELCLSCRFTRTRPSDADLDDAHVADLFGRTEAAKRRLVFQLLDLGLPLVSHGDDPVSGLAFDFLVNKGDPITIGHDSGVITIDLAESDDSYRERMRAELDEPYRTMLGHLRHEVGHFYWEVLLSGRDQILDGFRRLFGDERADYQRALERHYDEGPPPGWAQDHVSAYAAAHPWEDWAETWAHYLHIHDTLQTAASHGVIVTGPRFHRRQPDQPDEPVPPVPDAPPSGAPVDTRLEASLMASPTLDSPADLDDVLADWLPLTYALNAINRSMGKDDLYPFVLSPKVIEKLRFVHRRVRRAGQAIPD